MSQVSKLFKVPLICRIRLISLKVENLSHSGGMTSQVLLVVWFSLNFSNIQIIFS